MGSFAQLTVKLLYRTAALRPLAVTDAVRLSDRLRRSQRCRFKIKTSRFGSSNLMPRTEKIVVFVCDDEPLVLSTIRRILESAKRFIVLTCSDYPTGVNLFQTHGCAVHLALLDVALPGKNGVELARRLLSINPDVKIMFISGHVVESVLEHYGVRASDEHFVQEPFDSATLLRRVEDALRSPRRLEFARSAGQAADDQ